MDNERQGNGLTIIFAFFLGILTGAILSLLYAPSAGRDTRQKIRDVSTDAKDRTVNVVHKTTERARGTMGDLVDQSKERLHDAKDSMKAAVEAGKKTFSEKKAELASVVSHNSDSDDEIQESVEEEV